jgi:hypothetical protein
MANGPGRHGFRCPCGGVIGVRRTCAVDDGCLVRYRGCEVCGRSFKSMETLVTVKSRRSVKRLAQAIQRLLVD